MTAETYVYGASDDLIEIAGSVREEIYADEGRNLLVFSTGDVVEVEYGQDAEWHLRCIKSSGSIVVHAVGHDLGVGKEYSDLAVITTDEPPEWAVIADEDEILDLVEGGG